MTPGRRPPGLVLGPILRHAGTTDATVWLEADAACEVEVLSCRTSTFRVGRRHYAILPVTGLAPGRAHEYTVSLDGVARWPEAGSGHPPSAIRTRGPGDGLRLAFGSCRVAAPPGPPFSLPPDAGRRGRGVDALGALAERLAGQPRERWPDALLLLGDQVYVDRDHPRTTAAIRARRGRSAPRDRPADLEEHAILYEEAWSEPLVRWLLANVPSAMILDDHEVASGWNGSLAWRRRMERRRWWRRRAAGALMAYWLYQHLGNLSPAELARDPRLAAVRAADDGEAALAALAERWTHEPRSVSWSFRRDLGPARLVVIDTRARRALDPGSRRILDDEAWGWVEAQAGGGADHLLLATSVPWLLPPGLHRLEAWSERASEGAWGGLAARGAEGLRRRLGLEHWAAFEASFADMAGLLERVGSGARGRPPASILVLAGDVHHGFLTRVAFPRRAGVRSAVWQAVCSPLRNAMPRSARLLLRVGHSRAFGALMAPVARLAGAPPPSLRWRSGPPVFGNQVGTLEIAGRRVDLLLERAVPGEGAGRLEPVLERRLA